MVNLSFMQVYNPKNVQTFNKPVLAGHMHKNEAKTKENQTVSKNINLKFKEIIFQADAFQILFKLFHLIYLNCLIYFICRHGFITYYILHILCMSTAQISALWRQNYACPRSSNWDIERLIPLLDAVPIRIQHSLLFRVMIYIILPNLSL